MPPSLLRGKPGEVGGEALTNRRPNPPIALKSGKHPSDRTVFAMKVLDRPIITATFRKRAVGWLARSSPAFVSDFRPRAIVGESFADGSM